MQKVNKRKASVSQMLLFVVIIMLLFQVYIYAMDKHLIITQGKIVKDSLTMSNLATLKNIDLNTLGSDLKTTVILDTVSYQKDFKQKLLVNMGLSQSMTVSNHPVLTGSVVIDEMIIYNVYDGVDYVEIKKVDPNTGACLSTTQGSRVGTQKTPSGETVRKTSSYVNLKFKINLSIWGSQECSVSDTVEISQN